MVSTLEACKINQNTGNRRSAFQAVAAESVGSAAMAGGWGPAPQGYAWWFQDNEASITRLIRTRTTIPARPVTPIRRSFPPLISIMARPESALKLP